MHTESFELFICLLLFNLSVSYELLRGSGKMMLYTHSQIPESRNSDNLFLLSQRIIILFSSGGGGLFGEQVSILPHWGRTPGQENNKYEQVSVS